MQYNTRSARLQNREADDEKGLGVRQNEIDLQVYSILKSGLGQVS